MRWSWFRSWEPPTWVSGSRARRCRSCSRWPRCWKRTAWRARNAVTALMQFAPGEASVVHGSHEHKVPVSHLKVGALVRVRAGERIPCDGEVVSGASDVNQAMITGEALPAHKGAGDSVYAGTMNGDGTL